MLNYKSSGNKKIPFMISNPLIVIYKEPSGAAPLSSEAGEGPGVREACRINVSCRHELLFPA